MASEQPARGTAPSARGHRSWSRAVRQGALGALGVAVAALSAWQGTLTRHSPGARWAAGGLIALAVAAAIATGRRRQHVSSRTWLLTARQSVQTWRRQPPVAVAGVTGWFLVAALAIGWDLNSFAHQSHDLPTLSHFLGDVTAVPAGRGLLFAGWAVLGAYLALGRRRPR